MSVLLDDIITVRDMTTALEWLPDEQLEQVLIRLNSYRLFTNVSGRDARRFDLDALTAARAYRALYPVKTDDRFRALRCA